MHEYGKTENVFTRNPDTHKLNVGELRVPEFDQIKTWLVTEKIDGTNMRVLLRYVSDDNEGTVSIEVRGRSDRANTPHDLKDWITNTLHENTAGLFAYIESLTGNDPNIGVCFYGEGYGPGIQQGGGYAPRKEMRIFDVTTTDLETGGVWWRPWSEVERAAEFCGIKTVPLLERAETLDSIVENIEGGFHSQLSSSVQAEGVVCRTDPYLFTWDHKRVMFKAKVKDFG